tara:strand:+ start:522 stop:842 length:321 start_codon:yes stop_codon:yes gene_type:complete
MSVWPDLFPDQVAKYDGNRWAWICITLNAFCNSLYSKNSFGRRLPPPVEQDELNADLLIEIAQWQLFSDRDATFMFYLEFYGQRSEEATEHMTKTIELVYKAWRKR